MIDLTIKVDLTVMQAALQRLATEGFPATEEAVRSATLLVQRTWLEAASGREVSFNGRTFSIRRISGEYVRSISDGLVYPDGGDTLAGRVTADVPYARTIEEGTPARDMKPGLLGGEKVRRAKDGSLYTIIPFRHGTPGAATLAPLPRAVYDQARTLARSQITGTYRGRNAWGRFTRRHRYQWGGRLGDMGPGAHRDQPPGHEYTHTTSIYSGLVKMGKPGHTQYMTFRVVSSKSPPNSWWRPAVEPKPIAAAVAAMCEGAVTAMIRQGFTDDLLLFEGG